MDELEPAHLMKLTGRIYEAAIDPSLWDNVLGLLEQTYPSSRIALFGHRDGRPAESLTVHRNYPEDDLRAYIDYYVANSPFVARAELLPIGVATYSESVIGDRELHRTEHYNDYVRPRGLAYHAVGIVLDRGPARMTAISIANYKAQADRRARQARLLELIGPHLQRALQLHGRLAAERTADRAAHATFDRWRHAAFVLNATGQLILLNRAAESLLRRDDGLSLSRSGHLMGADHVVTRSIELAARKCAHIASSVDGALDSGEIDAVKLPRLAGPPLRAMFWPLPFLGETPGAPFDRGATLLIITDPAQLTRTPVAWLARQYGLSPSEERLTEAIVNGVSLTDAAEQMNIQLSTARTRLKIIQTKTQCHRQVDLVRLALSVPNFRDDEF